MALAETILSIASKAAAGVAMKWGKEKGSEYLGLDKTVFSKELENVIYNTISDFDTNFPIQDEGEKIPFYKSDILIQALLSIKFIGIDNVDLKELEATFAAHNIIPHSQTETLKFLNLFEGKCRENPKLREHQFNDNYKDAIFKVLEIVNSINSAINRVLVEVKASLKGEYLAQLDEIQENINSFKPKTALERLEGIESRIKQNNQLTTEIESRLLFLKGTCIIQSEKNIEGAKLIVRSYLNTKDSFLQPEAALAYLNLGEDDNAKNLAEQIILKDPYNVVAWLVLIMLSKNDYEDVFKKVPPSVKTKRGFIVSVLNHLKFNLHVEPSKLTTMGLTLPIVMDDKITYINKTLWELIVGLRMSEYFEVTKEFKFDGKGKIHYPHKNGLAEVTGLLNKFFAAIKGTEIADNYPHFKFYFFFIRHILGDDRFDKDEFKSAYQSLKDTLFHYDLHYAQFLANTGDVSGASEVVEQSKFRDQELLSFQLIHYKRTLGKKDEAGILIKEHIDGWNNIGFHDIFNLGAFFEIFFPDKELIKEQYQNILTTKSFQTEEIKTLFKIAFSVMYFKDEVDSQNVIENISALSKNYISEKNVLFYLAQLLFRLEAYEQCASILEPLTKAGLQTDVNLFYCQSLYRSNKNLPQLLKFLEEIRLKNNNNIYDLLVLEHNLRLNINDVESLIQICWKGVRQFPNAEFFHLNLISSLERKGLTEQIREYVQKYLKTDFSNESSGVWLSASLRRNGYVKEGTALLYSLATKRTNYVARTHYVTPVEFPEGFLIDYSIIEKGSYIKLVSKTEKSKLLVVGNEDKYGLVGKKRGDEVMLQEKLGVGHKKYQVARIMNAQLFLLEEILEEAKDGNSELNLETFDFTDEDGKFDIAAFEKNFVDRFAAEDEMKQKLREQVIESYNKGENSFTEVCRQVFDDNSLECYEYLTSQTFFALPAIHNFTIKFADEKVFAIDFTSLILFSDLKSKYGINIEQKFVVSVNLSTMIKDEVIKLQSLPSPKMKLVFIGGKIVPVTYPENYNQIQIEKYNQLLDFLSQHCVEKVVEEKLEFAAGLSEKHRNETYFNCLVDNALFATNLGYTLISNDKFVVKHFGKINPKQVSPELFLLRYFKGAYQKEMVDYFIEKHYVGVIINNEVLLREYRKKQIGEPNAFQVCLSNLKFRWSLTPINMVVAIKFLKEIYLNNPASDEEKFLLSQTVFLNLLDGCSQNTKIISLITASIYAEFSLLGESLDKILDAYQTAMDVYSTGV